MSKNNGIGIIFCLHSQLIATYWFKVTELPVFVPEEPPPRPPPSPPSLIHARKTMAEIIQYPTICSKLECSFYKTDIS